MKKFLALFMAAAMVLAMVACGNGGNNANNGTGGTGVDNPETGAGDVTGVATALALASLVSAAAVSLKKR